MRYNCVQCCLEIEMPFSKKDIEQIRRLRFNDGCCVVNKNGGEIFCMKF
jgi:hypothetical protein